jgi:hypothetical protein
MMDYRKNCQTNFAFARKMLLDRGEVAPFFVVYGRERIVPLIIPARDKDAQQMAVRIACVAEDASAVAYVGEAWTRSIMRLPGETDAEHHERATAVAPSEAEDRVEIVLANLDWRDAAGDQYCLTMSAEILRDVTGAVCGTGPQETVGPAPAEGRFAALLPPFLIEPWMREEARRLMKRFGTEISNRLH